MTNRLRVSFAAMLLITVAALVAMTGCGGKNNSSSSASKTVSRTVTSAEESTGTGAVTTSASVTDASSTQKSKTTTTAVTTRKSSKTTTAVTTRNSKKTKTTTARVTTTQPVTYDYDEGGYVEYTFRSDKYLNQHFEKHGSEFDGDFNYRTAREYEQGASDLINNPDALFKYEAEDGDGVYYLEETNEFAILSKDGYIRTYFRPSGGKSYFDRQ